jgi:hypothetical protein
MERRKCLIKSLKNELWNSWLTRMRIAPILLLTCQYMFHCGPACDTVLTNRQTEKLNFDTNYTTKTILDLQSIP